MRRRPAVIASAMAAVVVAAVLTGCSPQVALDPAPHANDPACASVTVHLPDSLENLTSRETNAQATGAWGDPAEVLLRCGVTIPTVSDLPCVATDDFFWLRDDSKKPNYVFTLYGRSPAVAVVIDQRKQSPGVILVDLETAISYTKPNGHRCLSVEDSLGGSASPTPTPSPAP